jgi:hypothetical protein
MRIDLLIITALLVSCTAGCVGYQLGSTLPPGIESVCVPAFENRTTEPNLERETTAAAIRELQKDGTLRIASAEDADSVLTVKLVKFSLEPLRYEKDRERTAKEYRLTITADILFVEARTGKELLIHQVEGESTFIASGDLSSGKRNALPEAAKDLAHDIVESVVEYW